MKLSLNWIREFVDLPKVLDGAELGHKVTLHTAEVEGVVDEAKRYEGVVIGKIKEVWKHPNANRLNVTKTDIGGKVVQIVCGGQNLKPDMLVAVALPGATVDVHGEGLFEIAEVAIRGEKSHGMICAGEEIWLEPDNAPGSKEDVKIKDLSWTKAKPGTSVAEALKKNDLVLDIDNKSLTHRPDLWGHYGFALEFAAIFKKDLKPYKPLLSSKVDDDFVKLKITIKDEAVCDRFSAVVMNGIKIAPSPEWMQNRLRTAGMNPHNNIVDITNYVMLELGQPMHAYDRQIVGSDELIVRKAKKDETLVTLEGTEHKLHPEDPLVCSPKVALGIGGIKGGLHSGISDETQEIILESAHFDPIVVRKASSRIGLRTDASQRFEKGLDPSLTEVAVQRAIKLVKELCPGAKVVSKIVTVGPWKPKKLVLTSSPQSVNKKIGLDLDVKEMESILKRLGFQVKATKTSLKVEVPSHRATGDVDTEEDLVEEIARIHGYAEIPAILPELAIKVPMENRERELKHEARRILAYALGFTEVLNYSFYGKDRLEACYLNEVDHLKVQNYLSEDQTHMRTSMTPNVLAVLARNAREHGTMKVFEVGHCYKKSGEFMPIEEKWLNVAYASDSSKEVFYEIKGAFEAFVKLFRPIGNVELVPSKNPAPYAHPKKCMDIRLRGETIGVLFGVHPGVLKNFDLDHKVGMFALNFGELAGLGQALTKFKEPSAYPSMSFDVSILVPEKKTIAELEKAIRSVDKDSLMVDVKLFDIYQGKPIPEGEKSVSFSITLQHKDRTLTDAESQALQQAVFLALEQNGGKIRGK